MSQDLFAAFGEGPTVKQTLASDGTSNTVPLRSGVNDSFPEFESSGAKWHGSQSTLFETFKAEGEKGIEMDNDDDDFGDFENAQVPMTTPKLIPGTSSSTPPSVRMSLGVEAAQTAYQATEAPSRVKSKPTRAEFEEQNENIGRHPFAGHMDLLFETGEDEYDAGEDDLADLATNPEAAMAYSKRVIAEQEAARNRRTPLPEQNSYSKVANGMRPPATTLTANETPNVRPEQRKQSKTQTNPNVLFDADDLSDMSDDEDWGDFEEGNQQSCESDPAATMSTQRNPRHSTPEIDLLSLKETVPETPNDVEIDQTLYSTEVSNIEMMSTNQNAPALSQSTSIGQDDDPWDDFETADPAIQPGTSSQTLSSFKPNAQGSLSESQQLPPTNIPPPSVLLSLFPPLFAAADEALLNALPRLSMEQKKALLAHPASSQFLKGYLEHCTVLAYLVAGRKLRWRRDQGLAQGMRIGPAAAGGKSGMKLAGIDKTESAKEEQEVFETVQLYRAQMGRLQTAATVAMSVTVNTSSQSKLPSVPAVDEYMAVKTLGPADGSMTAPMACVICGLRREERVVKIDHEVEDSFGEWWVKKLSMHVVCRKFWELEGIKLRRR